MLHNYVAYSRKFTCQTYLVYVAYEEYRLREIVVENSRGCFSETDPRLSCFRRSDIIKHHNQRLHSEAENHQQQLGKT